MYAKNSSSKRDSTNWLSFQTRSCQFDPGLQDLLFLRDAKKQAVAREKVAAVVRRFYAVEGDLAKKHCSAVQIRDEHCQTWTRALQRKQKHVRETGRPEEDICWREIRKIKPNKKTPHSFKALHSFSEPIPPCLTSCPLRPDRITPGKAPAVHDMEANSSLVHLDA